MTKQISAFIITFIFLGAVIWWLNANPDALPNINMDNTPDRLVKELSWDGAPALTIDVSKKYFATIDTTKGTMKFELFASETPNTVNNFVFLINESFYDGVTFHRVIDNFMVQGGDPDGTGRGGPGYRFEDELVGNPLKHETKVISMANAGPGTNGSQFFIVTAEATPWLDGHHTNFGEVTRGMDVVKKIEAVQTGVMDRPVEAVVVNEIELIK